MTTPDSDFFFGGSQPEPSEPEQAEQKAPEHGEPAETSSPNDAPVESAEHAPDKTDAEVEMPPRSPAPEQASESAETTDSASATDSDLARMSWEEALPLLQQRYPKASDGILFCVQKLLLDTELALPDIRGEAELRGLKIGGRSVHSAKVLLGLAEKSVRRRKVQEPETVPEPVAEAAPVAPPIATSARSPRPRKGSAPVSSSATDTLIAAIEQIQDGAREEAEQLRAAMREAIQVLRDALGED